MVDTHLLNKDNIVNLDTFLDDNYLSSKQITNCITKIPQNVILELNNGTLTLKAGSKLYVPNGFKSDGTTPKFDVITISNDISNHYDTTLTGQTFIWLYPSHTTIGGWFASGDAHISHSASGTTAPTIPSGYTYFLWYDTTNNVIKYTTDAGSTWVSGVSFPICLVSYTPESDIISVDQIFNGFGYVGSTVFALPGVEGLIPNGRNDNGTLKSIKTSITDVRILDFPVANLSNATLFNGTGVLTVVTNPVYDSDSNFNYNSTTKWECFPVAKYSTNSETKITSLTPKTPIHCVDYNDFNEVNKRLSSVEENYVTTNTNQTITGTKTFTSTPTINGGNVGGQLTLKNNVTTYGTSAVDLVATTSNGRNQFHVHFQEGNKFVGYWSQDPDTKNVVLSVAGCSNVYVPTPVNDEGSNQAATVGWVNTANKTGYGIGAPNYAAYRSITLDENKQYTATENGWIRCVMGNAATIIISSCTTAYVTSGTTDTIFPIAKGQTMTASTSLNGLLFIPCLG